MESFTGKLLVAAPSLQDPNFRRTVVLMCRHDEDGAMGIVLNRPRGDVPVVDHMAEWAEHVSSPPVIFIGGPVEPTVGMALARIEPGEVPTEGWEAITGRVGLVSLGRPPGGGAPALEASRIFAGYSGWAAGQLEGEIAEEAWFVVESLPGDAFSDEPESLWRSVLRRQKGNLAVFAYFPDDPSVN